MVGEREPSRGRRRWGLFPLRRGSRAELAIRKHFHPSFPREVGRPASRLLALAGLILSNSGGGTSPEQAGGAGARFGSGGRRARPARLPLGRWNLGRAVCGCRRPEPQLESQLTGVEECLFLAAHFSNRPNWLLFHFPRRLLPRPAPPRPAAVSLSAWQVLNCSRNNR